MNLLARKANQQAVQWSVGLLVEFLTYSKTQNAEDMERRKLVIRAEIASFRQQAEKERLAKVMQLEENLRIAERAGIVSLGIKRRDGGGVAQSVVIYGDEFPPYALGKQALQAELDEIRHRKSNDPFIGRLPKLQAELDLLEGGHGTEAGSKAGQLINPFLLKEKMIDDQIARLQGLQESSDIIRAAAAVDLPVSVPSTPIRPQMKKIIAVSFAASLMLSFLAVFVANFIGAYAQRKRDDGA